MSATCKHERTHQYGEDRAFVFSVAVHPYTEENIAAHGGISWTEECAECGARRAVNRNQRHIETSPWGLPRAEREAAEKRATDELKAELLRTQERADSEAVSARVSHLWVDARDVSRVVLTMRDGRQKEIGITDVVEAAAQADDGDGLVSFYRGLGRLIETAKNEPGRRVNV